METLGLNHFLSGVIAAPRAGRVLEDSLFRRYHAHVRTSAEIGGAQDVRDTSIRYEVGRISGKIGAILSAAFDDTRRVEASYPTNAILAEDFLGLARKYSNFSAQFQYSSLAGVAERIARGIAVHVTIGDVTSNLLRGGASLVVSALGTHDGPVNSLVSSVFIPRLVNTVLTGDVFSILANAVAGEGASTVTDIVEVDPATRQPIVPEVGVDGFLKAANEALRIIGANMIQSDQGLLFSFAVTKGIHSVVSVVSHTDEGGIVRDLLRCGRFSVPFGGIHYALEPYTGLPGLYGNNILQGGAFVDAIALTTAAVVAHADPGEFVNGQWFPTTYSGTGAGDPIVRPGATQDGTAAMSARIRAQLLADIGKFYLKYIPALGQVFGTTGSIDLTLTVATGMARHLGPDPRHLRYPSVSPWFWIEPTSLIPDDFLGSLAELNGSGSFGGKNSCKTKAAWEGLDLLGERDTTFSGYCAKFTSARRSWFLAHWNGHPDNGLGAIRVRQLDPNGIVHPGKGENGNEIRDRVEDNVPLSDYLWVRGQSPFCAPGEFMNLGLTMGFMVTHISFDEDGIPTPEHVPMAREFLDTLVKIEVGRPLGLAIGKSNSPDASARRARTRATIELGAASRRSRAFGSAAVGEMPTLTTAPRPHTFAPSPDADTTEQGGITKRTHGSVQAGSGASGALRRPDGAPVRAVGHSDAVRFPTIAPPAPQRTTPGPKATPPDQPHQTVRVVPPPPSASSDTGSVQAQPPAPAQNTTSPGPPAATPAAPGDAGLSNV